MDEVYAYIYEPKAYLRVSDEDSADFLQSQFSNDLSPFAEQQCTYGLWLDVKGKVVADSWVICEGEGSFRLISEHCEAAVIQDKLERHIIADDVEIEVLPTPKALRLAGAGVDVALRALNLNVPAVGESLVVGACRCFLGRGAAGVSVELVFSELAAFEQAVKTLKAMEIVFLDAGAASLAAMRGRVPQVPEQLGPSDLPGEGRVEAEAISFTKGCFLGQEVVARMHHVGQPRRGLYLVAGSGALPEVPSSIVDASGKSAGELRAVAAEANGRWLGVAMLKIRVVSVSDLKLRLGVEGEVLELGAPFGAGA